MSRRAQRYEWEEGFLKFAAELRRSTDADQFLQELNDIYLQQSSQMEPFLQVLSDSQQSVLITVLESGEVGPSTVAERLEISVSTAYRDLSVLEEHGLVSSTESGKRVITALGRDLAEVLVNRGIGQERREPTTETAQDK